MTELLNRPALAPEDDSFATPGEATSALTTLRLARSAPEHQLRRLARRRLDFDAETTLPDVDPIPTSDELTSYEDEPAVTDTMETPVSAEQASPILTARSRVGRLLQRLSDRVENGAERADRTSDVLTNAAEAGKAKIRGIGRVAARLGVVEFGAGLSVIAAKKGREVAERADTAFLGAADRTDAAFLDAADRAKENVKAKATATADKLGDSIMSGMKSVESGMDIVGDKLIGFAEGVKEKLGARKSRAEARKAARQERNLAAKVARRKKLDNKYDNVVEYGERKKKSYNAIKALGRSAIDSRN